jgi:hypothetical protein
MTDKWHLIRGEELYDMDNDPGQTTDVAGKHPEVVAKLRNAYEEWWEDISVNFDDYCEIIIDTDMARGLRGNCQGCLLRLCNQGRVASYSIVSLQSQT